eukprot:comp21363_c1_seq1/m.29342 comp21363_c1_seq1/g.29342  ORF comp21363_c1_seq1/g.29342 comp21363_c1_seq1/m.29342 type:complete len:255 (-) comp21363_c1_seq1:110-874(-)
MSSFPFSPSPGVSSEMAALLQAAEMMRLEEEGALDPKLRKMYGLDRVLSTDAYQESNGVDSDGENGENGENGHDFDSGSPKGRRRSIKNREMHNLLEKNRRAHLRNCFEGLRAVIPNMEDAKGSTVAILENATTCIQMLQTQHSKNEKEAEALRRINMWAAHQLYDCGAIDATEFSSYLHKCQKPSPIQNITAASPGHQSYPGKSYRMEQKHIKRSPTNGEVPPFTEPPKTSAVLAGSLPKKVEGGVTIEHHSP